MVCINLAKFPKDPYYINFSHYFLEKLSSILAYSEFLGLLSSRLHPAFEHRLCTEALGAAEIIDNVFPGGRLIKGFGGWQIKVLIGEQLAGSGGQVEFGRARALYFFKNCSGFIQS